MFNVQFSSDCVAQYLGNDIGELDIGFFGSLKRDWGSDGTEGTRGRKNQKSEVGSS